VIYKSLFLVFAPWLAAIFLYLFGVVNYWPITYKVSIVFSLLILSFVLGVIIGFQGKLNTAAGVNVRNNRLIYLNLVSFSPLIFICALYVFYDNLSQVGNINLILERPDVVRELDIKSNGIKKIASFFAYASFVFIPIFLSPVRRLFNLRVQVLYFGSLFIMALNSLAHGGRTFFLVFFILAYVSYLCRKLWRLNTDRKAFPTFLATALLFVCVLIVISVQLNRPPEEFINHVIDVELKYDILKEPYYSQIKYILISFFGYFVNPINNFAIKIDLSESLIHYPYSFIRIVLSKFGFLFDPNSTQSSLGVSHDLYLLRGGDPTGWTTGFGQMNSYFGLISIFVFAGVLGYLIVKYWRIFRSEPSLISYLKFSWVVYLFLHSIFSLPLDSIFIVGYIFIFIFTWSRALAHRFS